MRWLIGALLFACAAARAAAVEPLDTLTVQIENVSIRGGNVTVMVYDAASFAAGAIDPVYKKTVKANPGRMIVTFVGIAVGEYAVKVIQDVNRNKSRDKSLLGVVSEPVGWSNAGRASGTPRFSDVKFTVTQGDNRVIVRLWQ